MKGKTVDRLVHLLACLGEECGELQQIVGKSIRFGLEDLNKSNDSKPNWLLLREEFDDVWAVMDLIREEMPVESIYAAKEESQRSSRHRFNKQEKVERYLDEYS